jgi:thiol-disulfide isomerase/thioredoxin
MFIQTPRSEQPQASDFIDYYKKIDLKELTKNTDLLNYPEGLDLLLRTFYTTLMANENLSDEQKSEIAADIVGALLGNNKNLITNDTIKGEIVLKMARGKKSSASLAEYGNEYVKYLVTGSQKKRWQEIEAQLNKVVERKNAIDFKFKDKTDKEIALSDFKGKVVYVDIWATWCGPCKREFPAMKKLESEYQNNDNIVFIGVNTDRTKDKQKWLDFIEAEQLPGVQLFAGDEANDAIMKPYQISGIPRFILVGKDGKMIFTDAPRPSSNEIRAILNSALKE